mgnify:CR=1 FL=1
MQRGRLAAVIAAVLAIVVAACALLPVYKANANLGLDLQGGVLVRLEAPEGTSDEDMMGAISIINNRINGLGVSEPDVRLEGSNRIAVELPGVTDPAEAVRTIGTTAKMEFIRMDTGEVVVDGSHLSDAQPGTDAEAVDASKQYYVSLKFDDEGAKAFGDATTDLVSKYDEGDDKRRIAIVIDGEVVSAPTIQTAITNGSAQISGGFSTLQDASNLAIQLNSGALPIELKIVEQNTVGAQLGPDAIAKSLNAAIIGCILLALFLLVIYRGPGLVAVVSLVLYAVLLAGALIAIRSTITLQVIAAFLLSLGMAVDANVLIYERIKEELRNGKTVRVATDSGFKKAFTTILDANVTTLIATFVLMVLGTGAIRGFAITLALGIVISLFTAITFTKFVLRNLVLSGVIKSPKFYGVRRD